MTVRLVVTDMDGTLYSWIDYIVPAVESLVDAVCKATGFPRLKVVQSLKAVYSKYESNEYPFALQESSLYAEFPEFGSFDKLVIEPARMAFAEARRKYLKPYKTVVDTLPGFEFPAGAEGEKLVAPDILQKEERGAYRAACPVVELPREYEKPKT